MRTDLISIGRALAFGLVAAALSACASTPAPYASRPSYPYPGQPDVISRPPPIDADGYDPMIDPYAPPRVLEGTEPQQCVPFARSASGIEIWGDANTWWVQADGRYPRSAMPAPGSVLVLQGYNDTNRGHVAVVTHVLSSRVIRVDQANWLNSGEISLAVPVIDVSPANDWSQVKVWHIPGNHWGGRVYAAQGFIHPFLMAGGEAPVTE